MNRSVQQYNHTQNNPKYHIQIIIVYKKKYNKLRRGQHTKKQNTTVTLLKAFLLVETEITFE